MRDRALFNGTKKEVNVMNKFKQTLLISSGFAGGVLAGILLSSKSKIPVLENVTGRAEEAMNKSGEWIQQRNRRLRKLSRQLKEELTHPVPDLYRATESFALDEDDLMV